MKQQINEIKRMQQLAGIIAENQTNENIHNTIQMGGMFGGRNFSAEAEEDKKAVEDIKAAIANGASEKDAIEQVSKKYKLYSDYLKRRYDQSNKIKEGEAAYEYEKGKEVGENEEEEALKEELSNEGIARLEAEVDNRYLSILKYSLENLVPTLISKGDFDEDDVIDYLTHLVKKSYKDGESNS
jgi:uncharacterized protein YoaH (UPF0181 family)